MIEYAIFICKIKIVMKCAIVMNFSGKIPDEMIPFLLNSDLRELENHDKGVGTTEVQFQ